MDFLSRKKEYIFLNNNSSLVHVHVSQVKSSPYNLWIEGKSKRYRDCVRELNVTLKRFNLKNLPPIIIVANRKLGFGGISSYNHIDDVIYFNNYFHNTTNINNVITNEVFAARNLGDIIQHEMGHKLHWDAAKRFYSAHPSRYNSVEEAKKELDSKLEKYIAEQGKFYLVSTVSEYAANSYDYAKNHKKTNFVNEIIAEYTVLGKTSDSNLNQLIESVINYGKN